MKVFALRRFFPFLCLAVGLVVFGVSYISFGGPAAGPALYGCAVDWWCPPATCFPFPEISKRAGFPGPQGPRGVGASGMRIGDPGAEELVSSE